MRPVCAAGDELATERAVISIAGRPAYLERIYVKTRETGALPKVLYVELRGSDAATKKPVLERIASR